MTTILGDGISLSWPLHTRLLRAKELIFTRDRINAQQAVDFGLANRVIAPEKLPDEARTLAAKLLKQPSQALRETKKLMNLYLHRSAAHMLDTLGRQSIHRAAETQAKRSKVKPT